MGKPARDQNIKVFVRCRPLNGIEKAQRGIHTIVETPRSEKEIIVKEKINERLAKTFTFDKVFNPNSTQMDVYNAVARPLLEEVLLGYNCTLFAYGQTGTGKTFTMEGERSAGDFMSWEEDPLCGIIPRVLSQLFDELQMQRVEFTVRVSLVELYNEELFDLLSASDEGGRLRLYDDPTRKGSVVIQGLEEVTVQNKAQVYDILAKGTLRRQTAATLMNDKSSRSHTVFSVTVHIKENTVDGEELLKTGKLNLVDLAGSENISRSGAVEKRAREAGNINQSLLTLGRVITSLVERTPHIPYRESKLTRILQDSLGGRTKTSIIATVSPASSNLEETLSTLEYANRAKNIKNQPEINQKLSKMTLIKQYTEEIEKLRKDLIAAREKNGIYLAQDSYLQMMQQIEFAEKDNVTKMENICALKEKMEDQQKLFDEVKLSLANTERELNNTYRSLEKTTFDLQTTKQDLQAKDYKLEETRYLLNKVHGTESALTNEATDLFKTVTDATTTLEAVHQKLDRKSAVEEENKQRVDQFASSANNNLTDLMQDFVSNFQRNQQRQEVVCENAGNHIRCSKELERESVEVLKSQLAENQIQKLNSVKDLLKKQGSFYGRYLNESLEHCSSCCSDRSVPTLNQYVADVVAGLDALIDSHSQEHKILQSLAGSVTEQANDFKAESHREIADFTRHLNNSQRSIMELIQEQDEDMKRFGEHLNTEKEDTATFSKEVTMAIAACMEKLTLVKSMSEEYVGKRGRDREVLSETRKRMRDRMQKHESLAVEVRGRGIAIGQETAEKASKLTSQLEENSTSVLKTLGNCESITKQLVNDSKLMASSFAKERCAAWEGLVEHIRIRNTEVDEQLNAFQNEFENLAQEKESLLTNDVAECESTLSKWQSSCHSYGEETKMAVNKNLEEEWDQNHKSKLQAQRDSILKFCKEELKDDIPTGGTPQRRTWVYPQKLSATSPFDTLKNRFRENNALDLSRDSSSQSDQDTPRNSSASEHDTLLTEPGSQESTEELSPEGSKFKRSASTSDIAQKVTRSTALPLPERKIKGNTRENDFLVPKLQHSAKKLSGSDSNLKKPSIFGATGRKPKSARVLTPLNQ